MKTTKTKSVMAIAPLVAALIIIQWLPGCGKAPSDTDQHKAATQSPVSQDTGVSPSGPNAWTPQGVHAALAQKNPEYNGRAQFEIENGQVLIAALTGTGIRDLSPLKGMSILALDLRGLSVSDLNPLRGMPLMELYLEETNVVELAPLAGMKLAKLYLNDTKVRDLRPLRGMPLVELNLFGSAVDDLRPLRGLPIQMLWLNETAVSDISPLSDCPLVSLTLHKTQVQDLTPLAGSKLQRLHIGETPITDLTPIKELKLTRLVFTPGRITKGIEEVRKMSSIQEIGPSFEDRTDPANFWSLYAQGKFN